MSCFFWLRRSFPGYLPPQDRTPPARIPPPRTPPQPPPRTLPQPRPPARIPPPRPQPPARPPVLLLPQPGTWLDVGYDEKDEARKAGALWDPQAFLTGRWHAPPGSDALRRPEWAARPALPDLLPGEDRDFGGGLFVDLVPKSCWFVNARTNIAGRDWERVRRMVLGRAGCRCEACGWAPAAGAALTPLEAHERWSYGSRGRVQELRRLICLCEDCHKSTHLGRTWKTSAVEGLAAEGHLARVTGKSLAEVRDEYRRARDLCAWRSRSEWALDLGILTAAGIGLLR